MQLQIEVALIVAVVLFAVALIYRQRRSLRIDEQTIRVVAETSVSTALVAAFLDVPAIQLVAFALSKKTPGLGYHVVSGQFVAGGIEGPDLGSLVIASELGAFSLTVGAIVVFWKAIQRKKH